MGRHFKFVVICILVGLFVGNFGDDSSLVGAQESSDQIHQQFDQLRQQVQDGQPDAMDQLWELAQAHLDDENPELATLARTYERIILLQRMLNGDAAQAKPAFDAAQRLLAETGSVDFETIDAAVQVAEGLEKKEHYALAVELYSKIESKLPELPEGDPIDELRQQVGSSLKRLRLVGQKLELTGTTLDRTPLETDALDECVVLLDFWASWCTPCRKEMPLIRQLSDRYGGRGFRVVGVCMNEDREAVTPFLKTSPSVNWPILFEADESLRAFEHPLAVQAGVTRLPTAILIDRDGRVLSLAARGENLEHWLEKLFPDLKHRRSPLRPGGLIMTRSEFEISR